MALAEAHVRSHFRPDSIDLILADQATMEAFAVRMRRKPYAPTGRRRNKADGIPSTGFHLYRLWASDGRLLYVGVSVHLSARLRVHRARWGDLIARETWEEHPDERAMLAAERRAITDEDPAFNQAGIG